MSTKKFALWAVLLFLVFVPLIALDLIMIVHVIDYVIPLGGIEALAMSGLFIFAITVLPVFGVSPKISERINEQRFCRETNKNVKKESNAFIGIAILLFIVFGIVFLVMSVMNPDRFITGQGDPIADMFPTAIVDIIPNISEWGRENAVLAAWIMGLLPFATTVISFTVYTLLCMEKIEERLNEEIHVCRKKIEQKNKEIGAINRDIESSDAEKVLLNNLSDCINEIQHNINEFIAEKDIYLKRAADEQWQEFEAAQVAVEKQCWIDFNEFYEHGKQKLEPIKANRDVWTRVMRNWKAFCQEARDRIAAEMSSSGNSETSYAAMVIAPPQQKMKRGA
jgi:hypothetical protein